jgi:hypothetical protein
LTLNIDIISNSILLEFYCKLLQEYYPSLHRRRNYQTSITADIDYLLPIKLCNFIENWKANWSYSLG